MCAYVHAMMFACAAKPFMSVRDNHNMFLIPVVCELVLLCSHFLERTCTYHHESTMYMHRESYTLCRVHVCGSYFPPFICVLCSLLQGCHREHHNTPVYAYMRTCINVHEPLYVHVSICMDFHLSPSPR